MHRVTSTMTQKVYDIRTSRQMPGKIFRKMAIWAKEMPVCYFPMTLPERHLKNVTGSKTFSIALSLQLV